MTECSISDLATACIRCGFCLESCPTFGLTGSETDSPRGRIYLIRSADNGKIPWSEVRLSLDRCLGCRACESACPSGVQYGALLELARERLGTPLPHRILLEVATNERLLRIGSKLGMPRWFGRWVAGGDVASPSLPKAVERATPPNSNPGADYSLLDGCGTSTYFPGVTEAAAELLRRAGASVEVVKGCCGALHGHAGMLSHGQKMARHFNGRRLVTTSAGCGCWLAEQGIDVVDLSQALVQLGFDKVLATGRLDVRVTVHDACHLVHGQKVREEPRLLLRAIPGVQLVEMPDSERCCGSAGTYNLTQPTLAGELLDLKWSSIVESGAEIVVLGNPGCHSWILHAKDRMASKVRVLHLAEVLLEALRG